MSARLLPVMYAALGFMRLSSLACFEAAKDGNMCLTSGACIEANTLHRSQPSRKRRAPDDFPQCQPTCDLTSLAGVLSAVLALIFPSCYNHGTTYCRTTLSYVYGTQTDKGAVTMVMKAMPASKSPPSPAATKKRVRNSLHA